MMELHTDTAARIGLGTVQFGLDYGVSNPSGQVSPDEVARILELAAERGCRYLDTAALYGSAETVLGHVLPRQHQFRIVTKTLKVSGEIVTDADVERLHRGFLQSLERLECDSVYGLLVHDADDLLKPGGDKLAELLSTLRSDALVEKVGVSAYHRDQIDRVRQVMNLKLVQIPINIFDQRLIGDNWLSDLHRGGVEIHARSLFLQGLLLMLPEQLDSRFNPIKEHIRAYRRALEEADLTPLQAALRFGLELETIDTLILGTCSRDELAQIYQESSRSAGSFNFSAWAVDDPTLITPALWPSSNAVKEGTPQ